VSASVSPPVAPSLAEWGGVLPSLRVQLKVSPDSAVRRPRAPVRAGAVRSCHTHCLSAAPLPVHLRNSTSPTPPASPMSCSHHLRAGSKPLRPSSSRSGTTTRSPPTQRPSPTLEPPPSTAGCRSRRRLPLPEPRRCGGGGADPLR
jgi:hypothetical protein